MRFLAKAAAAALTVWGCSTALALSDPAAQGADVSALAAQSASADALYAERWIRDESDNHGHPFAIVDKKAARIFVFSGDGRLVGASPTLLGADRGDVAVPGSERKAPSQLLPDERRTPAGRFRSMPGRNNFGEDVVWVDYTSSIAIHRVRPDTVQASRLQSLSNDLPDDKRRSLGCVVVPESFLAQVVWPTLGHSAGVVYILPEQEPVQAMMAPPAPPTATAMARPADLSPVRTAVAAPTRVAMASTARATTPAQHTGDSTGAATPAVQGVPGAAPSPALATDPPAAPAASR